jgi:tetratricopeptide (TPR) repeat protein
MFPVPERKTSMSNNMDVRLIGKPCFVIMKVLSVFIVGLLVLVSGGCGQEQRSVDLYVDAVMLKEGGENEKAVEKLNSAVQLNKHFSLAYSMLGEIYQETEDYEKSAASYEKATELNPWSFKDYFNLGQVYQIRKEFTQAAEAYVKACELKPGHLEANVNAAKAYYEIKDYNSALIYGQRAEKIDPDVVEIQKMLGDIYESQENYDRAIAFYNRALEIGGNNPEIMISLAVAYLKTDRSSIAKELLTSVIQIQPDNKTAYKHLGFCCLQLKDADKSVENYSRAIEIDGKDWESRRGLGVAYMLKGKNEDGTIDDALKARAIQQWRLSLEINPNQPKSEKLLKLIQYYSKK